MSHPSEIHVNDIGTAFRITIYDENHDIVNVSGVITKDIIFTKPTNATVTKDATLINNGISGVIQYTTQSGDLDVAGIWNIQAHIQSSGSTYSLYTNTESFRVYDNLG